jgi:MYXO-CTERM domain-containing protein
MTSKTSLFGGVLLAAGSLTASATADQFLFEWSGTLNYATIPGTNVGDPVFVSVIADNGGNNIFNQVWDAANHFVSATYTTGTYSITAVQPAFFSTGFITDGAGNIIAADFADFDPTGNFDTFGSGGIVGSDGMIDSQGRLDLFNSFINSPDWTVRPVPAPAAAGLMGLAGLVATRRRR